MATLRPSQRLLTTDFPRVRCYPWPVEQPTPAGEQNLAATSWSVLAILSKRDELSGYDIKKVTEWGIRYIYWSPSFSQIYTELKKLEKYGLVTSRLDHDNGARSRRLYKITEAGLDAVTTWANEAPADPPVLKHSVVLRVLFGHLTNAERLKELLQEHVEYSDSLAKRAAIDAHGAEELDAWAYPRLALQWAAKYYAAERDLAEEMIKDIDAADEAHRRSLVDADSLKPDPAFWREVERKVDRQQGDQSSA